MRLERRKLASLGQILIRAGKITSEQLKDALKTQKDLCPNKFLGEILVDKKYISRDELYDAIALQFLYPYLDLRRYKFNQDVINLIPKEIVLHYKVIPLDKFGDILTVALLNPLDEPALTAVSRITGLKIRVFVTSCEIMKESLNLIYK